MKNYNNLNVICKSIWSFASYRKKILFFAFIVLSILISLLEIIGIVSLLNIMSFVTNGDLPVLVKLKNYLNLENYLIKDLFYIITFFFILITLMIMAARFCLTLVNAKLSFGIVAELNNLIFKKLAYLNFLDHKKLSINTSISNFSRVGEISLLVITNLSALSSGIIGSIVFISLLLIELNIVLSSSFIFFLIYFILIKISQKKLLQNSKNISESVNHKLNILSLLLGSIRNVILDNIQKYFINYHTKLQYIVLKSQTSNAMISSLPSLFFSNAILLIFIVYILIVTRLGNSFVDSIPLLAVIAFGAQKLIPLVNSIYLAISRNKGNIHNVINVLKFIDILNNKKKINRFKSYHKIKMHVKEKLILKDIKFKYTNKKLTLNNINLQLKRGDKVLIQGESGAGKTTLIEIISGLLFPVSGVLKVDNKTINKKNLHLFQKNISYVPQEIFLAEQSFLKNIVIGSSTEDIDLKKVKLYSKIAEIDKFINSTKNKYNTIVSYNGTNLSAGQKQRIGIARGLYKNSSILIFDESTSALDEKTETKIFNNIKKYLKDKIVIFISHNKKNIKYFNKVLVLDNGKLIQKEVNNNK